MPTTPNCSPRSRHQIIRLDRAEPDEHVLRMLIGERIGATVTSLTVNELDLVNDTTLVDVRFRVDVAADRVGRHGADSGVLQPESAEALR
ncbi:MAG: DUF4956 domain-containing protein [Microbacterium arborescens]